PGGLDRRATAPRDAPRRRRRGHVLRGPEEARRPAAGPVPGHRQGRRDRRQEPAGGVRRAERARPGGGRRRHRRLGRVRGAGRGASRADTRRYAAAADGLGDVGAAAIIPAGDARIDGPAVLVAIGIPPLGQDPKPPYHEVLCVVTLDRKTADTYAAGLRKG